MWNLVFLVSVEVNAAKVFSLSPSSQQLDTSKYPSLDKLPPLYPSWNTLYDFSKVPNTTVNTPNNNTGPAACSGSDPAFGQSGSCTWSCGGCTRPEQGDIVTCPTNNQWGLTFDDGPSPYTPLVLSYLSSKDIRATFFVVGSRVKEYPQTLVDMFNQGHQIGVHTWSHRALTTMTTAQVVSELQYSIDIIKQVTGTVPKYMRPPFGDIDDRIRAICKAMSLIPVMWLWDSDDILLSTNSNAFPNNQLQNEFSQYATGLPSSSQGIITLEHDLYALAAEVAPSCIDKILAVKSVTPMSVSQCIGDSNPYTDSKYSIPSSMSMTPQVYSPSNGVVLGSGLSVTSSGVVVTGSVSTTTGSAGSSTVTGSKNDAEGVSVGLAFISFAMGVVALFL